jgi:hypothetical protein
LVLLLCCRVGRRQGSQPCAQPPPAISPASSFLAGPLRPLSTTTTSTTTRLIERATLPTLAPPSLHRHPHPHPHLLSSPFPPSLGWRRCGRNESRVSVIPSLSHLFSISRPRVSFGGKGFVRSAPPPPSPQTDKTDRQTSHAARNSVRGESPRI